MSGLETLVFQINDLSLAHQKLISVFNQVGKPLKLAAGHIMILSSIAELSKHNRPVTVAEVNQMVGGSRTNLSQRITLLLERGYISEKSNEADRRSMLLELTPMGKKILKQAVKTFEQAPTQGTQVLQELTAAIQEHN